MKNGKLVGIIFSIILIILGIGLILAVILIVNHGTKWEKDVVAPPQLVSGQILEFKKQLLNRWNWTYNSLQKINGKDMSFSRNCYADQPDVNVYYGDKLLSRSDKKIFSTVSLIEIKDSTGKVINYSRTGNFFQTFVNQNRIWVKYALYDKDDINNAIAFVDKSGYLLDNIDIKDVNGRIIANLSRDKLTLSEWKWKVTVYDPEHPACDIRNLLTMAGKFSFDDIDNIDQCNSFVIYASIIGPILILFGLLEMIRTIKGSKSALYRIFEDDGATKRILQNIQDIERYT